MDTIDDQRLEVFVVWGPMLDKETRPDAVEATAYLDDERSTHFWTDRDRIAERFSGPVGLPADELAWDTFLLYPPGAVWDDAPPEPSLAMHVGKSLPPEQKLDGVVLAERARELLAFGAGEPAAPAGERPGRR
jgi:hypothetical protein